MISLNRTQRSLKLVNLNSKDLLGNFIIICPANVCCVLIIPQAFLGVQLSSWNRKLYALFTLSLISNVIIFICCTGSKSYLFLSFSGAHMLAELYFGNLYHRVHETNVDNVPLKITYCKSLSHSIRSVAITYTLWLFKVLLSTHIMGTIDLSWPLSSKWYRNAEIQNLVLTILVQCLCYNG